MKKAIFTLIAATALFASCSNHANDASKEQADSIAAARAADSMLNAASADTTLSDSAAVDTMAQDHTKTDSVK